MRRPVGPLSKFRNCSLLVALSGGVKELRALAAICTSLAPRPKPAQKYEVSHWTCIQPGPAPPRRCPAELMAFTAWGQPEIWQVDRALGRRPGGVRHNSLGLGPTSVLKMYSRRPIWMWLSQRALFKPRRALWTRPDFQFYKFGRAPF